MAAKVKNKSYMGNTNLPSANSSFEYTPEMVVEIEKCKTDIIHFASNYFYIIDPDSDVGKVCINLYDFQKRVLAGIFDHRFNCLLSPRQASKSTLMTIAALHEACFKPYKSIIIVANKEATAIEIFRRVRLAYEELPNWLKPGVEEYGKTGCVFDNGSRISISTTTGSAIRGTSLNMLIIDELAFLEEHVVDEFWKSVYPTISRSRTSKIIVASTPNGTGNLFHKIYTGAERGDNGFNPLRIEWNEIPGRDEAWKAQQIKALGSYEAFQQEFGNMFLDNSQQSIDEELFERLKQECCAPLHIFKDGDYKVWEEYDSNKIYAIGGDVSEGVGLDASVLEIFDITNPKEIIQVAEYYNNKIGPSEFTNVVAEICAHWGNPLLLIERNNQGTGVCDRLSNEFMYQNLVSWGAKEAHKNKQNGMISHINTKYKAVLNMRYFVNETKSVYFRSLDCLKEFKNFIRYPNGSWKAKNGEHDDRVMASVWALMTLYKDITEMYFDIKELDDCDKPLKIEPFDISSYRTRISTSIYNNEEIEKIENSNLAPLLFGGVGSEMMNDLAELEAAGWVIPQDSIYSNKERDLSYDQWQSIDKYFN